MRMIFTASEKTLLENGIKEFASLYANSDEKVKKEYISEFYLSDTVSDIGETRTTIGGDYEISLDGDVTSELLIMGVKIAKFLLPFVSPIKTLLGQFNSMEKELKTFLEKRREYGIIKLTGSDVGFNENMDTCIVAVVLRSKSRTNWTNVMYTRYVCDITNIKFDHRNDDKAILEIANRQYPETYPSFEDAMKAADKLVHEKLFQEEKEV